jgi:GAF domain-containing protein/HAMP domain-containing protein
VSISKKPAERSWKNRATEWLWISGIATLLFAASELAALRVSGSQQVWAILPIFLATPFFIWLVTTSKLPAAGIVYSSAIALQSLLMPLALSGLGVPHSIASAALISSIGLATLPRKYVGRIFVLSLITLLATLLIDAVGSSGRPVAPFVQARWAFSVVVSVLLVAAYAKGFLLLDLRTKIVTAILGTGGIALVIVTTFAFYQAGKTIDFLTTRLDSSVSQLGEEQIINTVRIEASRANEQFEDISEEVTGLAQNWVSLRERAEILNRSPYWDASKSLIRLSEGQFGNSASDTSSVFVPVGTPIDDDLITDLNVSAYLDFSVPAILQEHPSLLALYAIDTRGVTRYYPNIELASVVPPDFDTTERPYYLVASPLFNPQQLPRWTIPYVDATGGGLVVTVAAPVYEGNNFAGVLAADMQLTQITEQISAIKMGKTGYAFMIDDAGRIISMPEAGFDMFGLRPEDMNSEEFFKQTILGEGSVELQALTKRMTAGGSGLLIIDVNGIDTYISFHPVKTNGYSVALVVPVAELQGAITVARNETEQQIKAAILGAATILLNMLVIAFAISLGLGQVIAAPIQRLTLAAKQITAGDLTVQTSATTSDEIGTLANAFNTMTSRLRESLEELEKRVDQRTAELSQANERIERRAKQFEAIAHITRTITSTRDLDLLLSQITTVINEEFGFYHIGIFLLDPAKEYAILSAANSDGGKKMLERGHRLKIGETGLVGFVTGTGKPRVALDTEADTVFFNNPDLPRTRSEIALPLRVGDEIIGALDVQSTVPNAFLQEDINILSTLADQVSIAIQNAQQFEETRKALSESEVLTKQFVQSGWQRFTKARNLLGIRHTGARGSLLHRRNGKEEDLLASNQFKRNARGAALSLPIKLRGEVIGFVDIRTPDNRPWDQDELDIVTAIIERAAIALENARLLEESQKNAEMERLTADISGKIGASINLRNVLETAVEELGHLLPGSDIVIQFSNEKQGMGNK